jgi:hypothetical protein
LYMISKSIVASASWLLQLARYVFILTSVPKVFVMLCRTSHQSSQGNFLATKLSLILGSILIFVPHRGNTVE